MQVSEQSNHVIARVCVVVDQQKRQPLILNLRGPGHYDLLVPHVSQVDSSDIAHIKLEQLSD